MANMEEDDPLEDMFGKRFKPVDTEELFDEDRDRDVVLGAEIVPRQPDCMHFITGVAFFDVNPSNQKLFVADNKQFRQIIKSHFQARLQDQRYVSSIQDSDGKVTLRVVGEIDKVLARAVSTPIERLKRTESLPKRICIWKKVSHKSATLQEATWRTFYYKDVSNDPREVRKVLAQPLRTELAKLSKAQSATAESAKSSPTVPVKSEPVIQARELHESEKFLIRDIQAKINQPTTYVAALFTLRNEQDATPANDHAADRIADSWRLAGSIKARTNKKRFVYRFDASDPGTLASSYSNQAQKLKSEHCDTVADSVKSKTCRLDQKAAADAFLATFRSHFPRTCECLLIYTNVPHPEAFREGFLPELWLQDDHCRDTIQGVLLCTQHPEYMRKNASTLGHEISFHPIEWKPQDPESGQTCWWDRLPPSNLPYSNHDIQEPPGLDEKMKIDGRAFCLVGNTPSVTNQIAAQAIRRWESAESGRFAIWLDASNEEQLREGYQTAIRQITFSSSSHPLGDPRDLSTRSMADSLMALLTVKRQLSKRDHRWALVFANDSSGDLFPDRFFSGDSNWWNSRGRFIVTTSIPLVPVEIGDNGTPSRSLLPFIECPDAIESSVIEELRATTISNGRIFPQHLVDASASGAAAPVESFPYDPHFTDEAMRDDAYHEGDRVRGYSTTTINATAGLKKRKAQILDTFYQQHEVSSDSYYSYYNTKPSAQRRY